MLEETFTPSKILPLVGTIFVSLFLWKTIITYTNNIGLLAVIGLVILLFLDNIRSMAPNNYLVEINNILVAVAMFFIINYFGTFMPVTKTYIVGIIGLALIVFGR